MNSAAIPVPTRVFRLLALVALTLLLAPVSTASAGDWTVGEITGPAGTTRIIPAAVNAGGVVVGTARFAGRDRRHGVPLGGRHDDRARAARRA